MAVDRLDVCYPKLGLGPTLKEIQAAVTYTVYHSTPYVRKSECRSTCTNGGGRSNVARDELWLKGCGSQAWHVVRLAPLALHSISPSSKNNTKRRAALNLHQLLISTPNPVFPLSIRRPRFFSRLRHPARVAPRPSILSGRSWPGRPCGQLLRSKVARKGAPSTSPRRQPPTFLPPPIFPR